jgi:hypothetical protein
MADIEYDCFSSILSFISFCFSRYRLANGATEKLQLSALISTFQKARQVESS